MTDMTQEPRRLSQGINYLGFLAQELGDLQGIGSLAHELIQNADDAKDAKGDFAATEIIFDVTDEALVVTNDAVFLEEDFARMQTIAAGGKRNAVGGRTTGMFGVGFISVYQVTDHPEVFSSGRHWTFYPEENEAERIEEYRGDTTRGTKIRLPWAIADSDLRRALRASPITAADVERLTEELAEALPQSILFLKNIRQVELRRNGQGLLALRATMTPGRLIVERNSEIEAWTILEGDFAVEGERQKRVIGLIERNRGTTFQIAIPDRYLDSGLFFATLPTEQLTGLPFHLNADFYPQSDRKAILLGGVTYQHVWNKTVIEAAAGTLVDNFNTILAAFDTDPETLWSFLDRLHRAAIENAGDTRRPVHLFWENLADVLPTKPVVFSETGSWLMPSEVRMPTGQDQEESVPVLTALGIETVHSTLRRHRNILVGGDVGVPMVRPNDILSSLRKRGLVDEESNFDSLPEGYRSDDGLRAFWKMIQAVIEQVRPSTGPAERLLEDCSLAPCRDGSLRPFYQAFRADEEDFATFAPLVDADFLMPHFHDEPLAKRLCPEFCSEDTINLLSDLETEDLAIRWQQGLLSPKGLLSWFEAHSSQFLSDDSLRARLASLPIFPSGKALRPLTELTLPGDFVDELGLTDLIDVEQLRGLGDFLRKLGARELTFPEYAATYMPSAFQDRSVDSDTKRRMIVLLIKNLGQVRENAAVKAALTSSPIIECEDGGWRRPSQVYFASDAVRLVFGTAVPYAAIPKATSESTSDLYGWLGVASFARPQDILGALELISEGLPTNQARRRIANLLDALGKTETQLTPSFLQELSPLKNKAWLPAEDDFASWHTPDSLHSSFRRYLFASQATWLDVPLSIQQSCSGLLAWLGVRNEPTVEMVVEHLLKCAADSSEVHPEVYAFLNGPDVSYDDLAPLRNVACLRLEGRYVRPDQAFWSPHPFGRFRVSLGATFTRYSKFLELVGVGQSPTFKDALLVLEELSASLEADPSDADLDIVDQCWLMLATALESQAVSGEELYARLHAVKSVPNYRGSLCIPTSIFFEDRPGLSERFRRLLEGKTIPRPDRSWVAMAGAGVRPLSEVVIASLVGVRDETVDDGLKQRVIRRRPLIRSILSGGSVAAAPDVSLEQISFVEASEIEIRWTFRGQQDVESEVEIADAFFEQDQRTLYFARRGNRPPWSAIARELSYAMAPAAEVRVISPGLRTILEAADEHQAQSELYDLGIADVREVGLVSNSTHAVEYFDAVDDEKIAVPIDADSVFDLSVSLEDSEGHGPVEFETSFAQRLFEAQALELPAGRDIDVQLPNAGPNTVSSAERHTEDSFAFGRAGGPVRKSVTWWTPRPAAKHLEEEFRSMAFGDYAKRCQICSRTFGTSNGEQQAYVVHLVEPSRDSRTNHYGNLASLCGWHYALVQFGRWTFLDPLTELPPATPNALRDVLLRAERKVDESGNDYYAILIQFANVYENWDAVPRTLVEEMRYSEPHWLYLRELLTSDQGLN